MLWLPAENFKQWAKSCRLLYSFILPVIGYIRTAAVMDANRCSSVLVLVGLAGIFNIKSTSPLSVGAKRFWTHQFDIHAKKFREALAVRLAHVASLLKHIDKLLATQHLTWDATLTTWPDNRLKPLTHCTREDSCIRHKRCKKCAENVTTSCYNHGWLQHTIWPTGWLNRLLGGVLSPATAARSPFHPSLYPVPSLWLPPFCFFFRGSYLNIGLTRGSLRNWVLSMESEAKS